MDVSICITTYNHEKYIRQCLISIFEQKFSGTYEIVIGNDNSSDQTEAIIQNIMAEHPLGSRIVYLKNNPNIGYVKNTLRTFEEAKGKYIAVLDGDDYWTDGLKLQRQFDFLETHPDFSAVGCDSDVIYEDAEMPPEKFSKFLDKELDKKDLTQIKIFQTSTFFFRKDILKEGFPTEIISADRCLFLLAGCFGKVKVLPQTMAVYRQFQASISKNVRYETMKKDFAIIPYIEKFGRNYRHGQLKAYFYYTLMTYPTKISKLKFALAAAGYLFNNVLAKFTPHPLKMYSAVKWTLFTIRQKYRMRKVNRSFITQ